MGWTSQHRAKGTKNADFFKREWAEGYEQVGFAGGSINRNHSYAALRTPEGHVIGVAIQTKWIPKDHFNFMWRTDGEGSGPIISDMPEKIYKLLTPLEQVYPDADFTAEGSPKWAMQWRERILDHLQRMKDRVKLSDGLKVAAPYDISFGSWTLKAGEPFFVNNAKRKYFSTNANNSPSYYSFRLRKETTIDLLEVSNA